MRRWMQTYLGHKFTFTVPRVQDIHIEDIAHSLALQCRFNGHIDDFYSVGDHCLYVLSKASEANKFWGLMHEATETYISDIITPLKYHWRWRFFIKRMENKILKVVAKKYGLPWPIPKEIHEIDERMWATEQRDLRRRPRFKWSTDIKPYPERVVPTADWRTVKAVFLDQFANLRT